MLSKILYLLIFQSCTFENLGRWILLFRLNFTKSVRLWSYSGPYFPAFGLNTERYTGYLPEFSLISDKCGPE